MEKSLACTDCEVEVIDERLVSTADWWDRLISAKLHRKNQLLLVHWRDGPVGEEVDKHVNPEGCSADRINWVPLKAVKKHGTLGKIGWLFLDEVTSASLHENNRLCPSTSVVKFDRFLRSTNPFADREFSMFRAQALLYTDEIDVSELEKHMTRGTF